MGRRREIIFLSALVIVLFVFGIWYFYDSWIQIFTAPETIKSFVQNYGVFSPIAFIFLAMLQVIIAPIPGQIIGIGAGYIYGPYIGTLYAMTGIMIGSFLIFVFSRKFGRPFVEKIVDAKTLDKFDGPIKKNGKVLLFLFYLLPGFPDDLLCYVAGLTKIRIRDLVFISTVGRFPSMFIVAIMGAEIGRGDFNTTILWFEAMILITIFIYLFKDKLESGLRKLIKKDGQIDSI